MASAAAASETNNTNERVPSRLEKKFRKTMMRALNLTPVEGVKKIEIRKARELNLAIASPDVYKVAGADCYVVFGYASVEDANKGFNLAGLNEMLDISKSSPPASAAPTKEPQQTVEDVTDAGEDVDEKNIELVMTQGNCSRDKAVAALREHQNDVVEAIMAVSSA